MRETSPISTATFRLSIALLLLVGTASSPATNTTAPTLLEFATTQSNRQFTHVPREVLAFYYTWYGRPENHGRWIHWGGENAAAHDIPESTHYPKRGAYDSHDPEIIEAHIAEAKAHGVSGFIATWWGQRTFDDRALQLLLDHADTNEFKVTIYWETAPGAGPEQIARAIDDLSYVLRQYGSRPAFLKVDGKPVIFIYGRVMNEVPLASWPEIITRTRAQAGDFLLVADGYTEAFARVFDGVHTYNNCGDVAGKSPEALRAWSARHYTDAVKLARTRGKISCVTVIPGYDDTKIRKPGLNAARQDGQTYRVLWEEALKADPDWMLITSWNEWHEGSEIEPSWEDDAKYLTLTSEYAPRFLACKTVHAAATAGTAIDTEAKEKLQARFRGRTIAVLPDFDDTAFWLADVGLAVQELSWAEVVDPVIFNPRHFPVVLHAGGEHYRGTVKDTNDVPRALQRYLAQGGFLVSMPHQPFPFHYDDASGEPKVIANQIGLPVQGGWEQPPAGRLVFRFDTNALAGLSATAPFPETGDLRWRPARRTAVGNDDLYTSLASLADENGQAFGDGIAYVEHRTPSLKGGRTLYVWMRMDDVAGRDELLAAIFLFVGEKQASGVR